MATTVKTLLVADSPYTWVCPPGVTSVQVECLAGGGGGGKVTSTTGVRGGGGGGEYAKEASQAVTPGTSYTCVIGAAGGTDGSNGGDTTFGATLVVAHKGNGAGSSATGATGGTGSTNTVHYDGGTGATGSGSTAGGGGSSAGTAGNGNNGSGATGGSAPTGGYNGGNGRSGSTGTGTAPTGAYGGGGGGAYRSTSGTSNGGAGKPGRMILTYTTPLANSLQDNFNDNSFDTVKWQKDGVNGATTNETGETIVVAPLANTDASEGYFVYNGFTATFDLTGSYFAVNVKQILNDGEDTYTALWVQKDDSNLFFIRQNNGILEAKSVVADNEQVVDSVGWNPTTMKWWRIREMEGTIYYDYSQDGLLWTNFASVENPFAVTLVYPKVNAISYSVAVPGSAIFDNFNAFPAVSTTGTLLSTGVTNNFLGVNINSGDVAAYAATLYNAGIRTLRVQLPNYQDAGLVADCETAVLAAIAAGHNVIWGVSSNNSDPDNTITAENWGDYSDAVLAAAAWAQANGVYEFQIGNEEELHSWRTPVSMVRNANVVTVTFTENHGYDGTHHMYIWGGADSSFDVDDAAITVTGAKTFTYASVGSNGSVADPWSVGIGDIPDTTLEANLKTLATSVQAVFTRGNVSYSAPGTSTYRDDWLSLGRGDIDILAWNVYLNGDNWETVVDNMIGDWGVGHTYVSEFGPNNSGLDYFSTDQERQAAAVSYMIDVFKADGIQKAIWYNWKDDDFGAMDGSGNYRSLWNVLAAQTLCTEDTIRTGGKTIILTLANDTWVAAGATFDGQRQNIINGIDSAQAEAHGWDAEVKAKIGVGDVVRTSDTIVTITLDAEAGYDITANEFITATIPASALVGGVALVAYPVFGVAYVASTGHVKSWNGTALAHIKSIVGTAIAHVKSWDGITF